MSRDHERPDPQRGALIRSWPAVHRPFLSQLRGMRSGQLVLTGRVAEWRILSVVGEPTAECKSTGQRAPAGRDRRHRLFPWVPSGCEGQNVKGPRGVPDTEPLARLPEGRPDRHGALAAGSPRRGQPTAQPHGPLRPRRHKTRSRFGGRPDGVRTDTPDGHRGVPESGSLPAAPATFAPAGAQWVHSAVLNGSLARADSAWLYFGAASVTIYLSATNMHPPEAVTVGVSPAGKQLNITPTPPTT